MKCSEMSDAMLLDLGIIDEYCRRFHGKEFVAPRRAGCLAGILPAHRAGRRPAPPLAIVLFLRRHLDMRPSVVTSGTLLASTRLRFKNHVSSFRTELYAEYGGFLWPGGCWHFDCNLGSGR